VSAHQCGQDEPGFEPSKRDVPTPLDWLQGARMPVSLVELREQARLLEADLTRQTASSDSVDTRAGVAVGFAGVLVGLLLQVRSRTLPLIGR